MKSWIPTLSVIAIGAIGSLVPSASEGEGRPGDLRSADGWLNSPPLDSSSLRGKVVLVNFWTYSCINSLRELPYLKEWAAKYKDAGLVVVGVHSPEFGFEKDRRNVEKAVRDLNVAFPVAIDSDHRVWQAFNNEYWPADYFIDAKGKVRYQHFGEGDYEKSERVIQDLLRENGAGERSRDVVTASGRGIEAPPSADVQSPETYVGYSRAENFTSRERLAQDSRKTYSAAVKLALNQWALAGTWSVGTENGVLQESNGKVVFRFHARDLHMVMGPSKNGRPVRFRVKLDGNAPEEQHGVDSLPDGTGEISEPRLYQLIRQKGRIEDRTFEIEFLDPGVRVFSFTFG